MGWRKNRAKVIETEASAHRDSQAFRKGNLGIMDYYRMEIFNDTDVRMPSPDRKRQGRKSNGNQRNHTYE